LTTPNLTSGVTERNKPVRYPHNVCWRFEGTLNAGTSITTPIFDVMEGGNPLNEVEVGAVNVVRVASRYFVLSVLSSALPGARINVFHITDTGSQDNPFQLYVPVDGGTSNTNYRYECVGRRCQFRLQNTPLGVSAAANQVFHFEIVNEGVI